MEAFKAEVSEYWGKPIDLLRMMAFVVFELEGRFGKPFERTYGWAADALQNQNPRIRDIEEAAGYAHSRAHYGFASLNVHANAKGILYRISQPENQKGLIAGPSVWGLADPITCTAVTITQLLSVLNKQWGTMDSTAGILVLERLMKRVNDSLEDAGPCDEEITDGFPGSDEPIMPDDEWRRECLFASAAFRAANKL